MKTHKITFAVVAGKDYALEERDVKAPSRFVALAMAKAIREKDARILKTIKVVEL